MNEFHDATVNYTNALVWYHSMVLHTEASKAEHGTVLREDFLSLKEAYDSMFDAQNRLNNAALARAMAGA